ncbi:MAG: T9SS type A sorting domain-containing protein [Sphingobacteriaceae bacterium]|nr:T9SS type A sorting domain-containing protein [Sphingobacteriaceae bacterium]
MKIVISIAIFFSLSTSLAQTTFKGGETCINTGSELITNGDFTLGNTGFSIGFNYSPICGAGGMNGDGMTLGNYDVSLITTCYGYSDRNSTDGMILHIPDVVGANVGQLFWGQTVNVIQNQTYVLSLWAFEPNGNCPYQPLGTYFDVYINNVLIKNDSVGGCGIWFNKNYLWNSGSSTTATIQLKNGTNNVNIGNAGVDPSFDGISLKQCLDLDTKINVNQNDLFTVNVMPNPSSGKFNFKTNLEGDHILIVDDVYGKHVKTYNFKGNTQEINLEEQSSGVYIISVRQANRKKAYLKIIKE